MSGHTDWLSAIGMLLSGLIVAFMFWYASKRKKETAAAANDLELRDLEARRDLLIQQLRELEDTPANAAERARLEREAAEVLRKLDGVAPAAAARTTTQAVAASPSSSNAALKGFLWGAGSVAALGFLGWFVYQSSTDRKDAAPVQSAPMSAQTQSAPRAQADPAVQQLEAAVAAQPDNVDARINLTKAYLEHENTMGAFEQTQAVLQKSPNEPRALTYQALVRMSMGQQDVAARMLQQAVKADPKLLDAWVGIAWLDFQSGKPEDGEKAMHDAMREHPEQRERLEEILSEMKAQQKGGAAPAAAATAGPSVHITLNVDPAAAARVPQNATVFVFARAQGVTSGPPIAVKRLSASSFPMQLDLSSADSMMGQQLPPAFRLEARIDSDGNAMTKSPDDLNAVNDAVTSGSNVTLTLK